MKRLALVALIIMAAFSVASAQGYQMKKSSVGPLVGFGWHDLMIGGQFEYGFHKNIGGGALVGWSGDKEEYYPYGEWSYSYIVVAGQGNWHFKPGEKFDPFVGIVLGYDIVSADWEANSGYETWHWEASGSEMVFGGNLGMNYDLSPSMAFSARLGYPYYLAAGVNFKF